MNRLSVSLLIIASTSSVFAQDLSDATYMKIGNDQSIVLKSHEIVPVEIEILPFAVLFEKGSTLELIVKGSGISKSANNQHMKLVNMGNHSIYAGKKYDSYLMLPIVN